MSPEAREQSGETMFAHMQISPSGYLHGNIETVMTNLIRLDNVVR